MKKIVAAAVAGLVLAGAAFADVSFSYTGSAILGGRNHSYDAKTDVADQDESDELVLEKGKSSLKQLEKIYRNDCLSLSLSNDIAGVVCDWDITSSDSDTFIGKNTGKDGKTYKDNPYETYDHEGTVMSLDAFYAWMTFGLPVGNLQITSGKWTSRYVNRVNSFAGDLDSVFYESFKPGNIASGYAKDSDNLTEGAYSTVLAYTLADTLPGTLMVKFGLVSSDYNKVGASAQTTTPEVTLKSGFVGEVCWFQEGLIKANVAVKNPVKGVTSLGIFVSPLMVENLDCMAGFSTAMVDSDWKKDYSEIAFDLRATYNFTEKTSLTGMFNYSNAGVKDADTTAMWTMLSVGYKAGDNIRYVGTIQNTVSDFDAKIGEANVFAISPACEVKASESCNVTVGFDMRWTDVKPFSGTADVSVPIYVSFSL